MVILAQKVNFRKERGAIGIRNFNRFNNNKNSNFNNRFNNNKNSN